MNVLSYSTPIVGGGLRGFATSSRSLRGAMATVLAVAGAGVIAMNPATPGVAGLAERAIEVQLTGAFDDVDALATQAAVGTVGVAPYNFLDVATEAFQNVEQTAEQWLADPFPILSQLGTNWLDYGEAAAKSLLYAGGGLADFVFGSSAQAGQESLGPLVESLIGNVQAGDFYPGAAQDLAQIMGGFIEFPGEGLVSGGIFDIPIDISAHIDNVVNTVFGSGPAGLLSIFGGVVGSVLEAPILQTGAAFEAGATAWEAGNYLTALGDFAQMPASFAYGLLNGIDDPTNGLYFAGLLTAADTFSQSGGLLANLAIVLPQQIAADLASDAATSAATSMAADQAVNLGTLVFDLLSAL